MTVRVPVSPTVLEWAADQAGLDDERIHDAFPKWDEWLAGERQPTLRQLEQLADKACVPFGYLLLNDPPHLELPIPDFRRGFGGRNFDEPSPNLRAVLNQSLRRQDWYRGFALDNGFPVVDVVGAGRRMSVTEAAAHMRDHLRFNVSDRTGSWGSIRKHLVRSFENIGGLTVVTSMVDNNTKRLLDPDEFRGFTLIDEYAPLVFVNARQTLNGQIFTLAHEFAHVWHGTSGISLEDPDPRVEMNSRVERWCDAVASEFLVPEADLVRRYQAVSDRPLTEQLENLAQRYKCGTLVVLQRLRNSGVRRFEDFDRVYDAEVQRLKDLAPPEGEGGSFFNNQPYRIGRRLSRALIGDALEGRTPISEAIRLMSLGSLSNFDKYARHLGIS